MTEFTSRRPRTSARRFGWLLVVAAAIVACGIQTIAAFAPPPGGAHSPAWLGGTARLGPAPSSTPRSPAPSALRRPIGEADGVAPVGTTVFDDQVPAVAKLNPKLLRALRDAATAAARDDVVFVVNSGWRSVAYQQQLLRHAVAKYGSTAEAARWVASPARSAHVAGDAVDLGPSDALSWLSQHGAEFGLCRVYANEPWHYELRPDAVLDGCPPQYADSAHDPRTHR
jgi:hypothetical protein